MKLAGLFFCITLLAVSFFAYFAFGISLGKIGAFAGVITAILGAGFLVWNKILEPLIDFLDSSCGKVWNAINGFETVNTKLDKITYELGPNSGKSIKDAIHRIEDKLSIVDEELAMLTELDNCGIFKCNLNGENLSVNRTYCQLLGTTKTKLLGYGWRTFLADVETRDKYDSAWKNAFEEGRECVFNLDFHTRNGIESFHIHTYPLHDKKGNPAQYIGYVTKAEEI